jgi:hypothetical protein
MSANDRTAKPYHFNAVPDLDPVVLAALRRHLTRGAGW